MPTLEQEMIRWGRWLFDRRLISGWGGNLSCRVEKNRFLITGQHASLGFLTPADLVRIDGKGKPLGKKRQASSETSLHLAVYKGTDAKAVIHAHPPKVLAFSLSHQSFVPLSFEEKYTLGEIPVIAQETPTVTDTKQVTQELRVRPIVILRGHGTVAVGHDLKEAFLLTDLLEEAVGCHFLKSEGSESQGAPRRRDSGTASKEGYRLLSPQHAQALVESVSTDSEFSRLAQEARLKTTLTVAVEEGNSRWTFYFAQGKITDFEAGGEGEFVISGKREWWEAIFQGRLDPFLATQEGKLRLVRGELWKLSQWFKPFQRAFTLWQAIPAK